MDYEALYRKALAASHAASSAAAELIRFTREGPVCNLPFSSEIELVTELADALRHAIEIQRPFLLEQPCYAQEREDADQLAAACDRYLADCSREPV